MIFYEIFLNRKLNHINQAIMENVQTRSAKKAKKKYYLLLYELKMLEQRIYNQT